MKLVKLRFALVFVISAGVGIVFITTVGFTVLAAQDTNPPQLFHNGDINCDGKRDAVQVLGEEEILKLPVRLFGPDGHSSYWFETNSGLVFAPGSEVTRVRSLARTSTANAPGSSCS